MNFESADAVLDFAIEKEEEAFRFYDDLAEKMAPKHMKEVFHSFALEEKGHKAKLESVKKGKKLQQAQRKIEDLKIGDYLPDVETTDDMTYQDALIIAMKAEKAAYKLYSDLAQTISDANLKELFLLLAQEEARHKLRFEVEYDDHVLREN